MEKKRLCAWLLPFVLLFALLPTIAFAEGTGAEEVYVSGISGNDGNTGTQAAPYATLAKAVEAAAENGATIYVMSDLTMTKCARFHSKSLTITSDEKGPYTVTRDNSFTTQSDHARSWYNPAMVEVQTTGSEGAGLTLTNIVFDDDGKKEGTVFAQAVSDGSIDNKTCVQDAIIASNATVPTTITLGDGAVLRNFGGMSAVRATGAAKLVMESGSVIEDVVNNCQHPNAAKLLIRFMMGGTDGDTSGNDPFNTLGGWPVRDDIEPAEGSVPLEDWNLIHVSTEDIYYNINKVRDFWTTLG